MPFDMDAALADVPLPDEGKTTASATSGFDMQAALADIPEPKKSTFDMDAALADVPEKPGLLSRIGTGISNAVQATNDAWDKSEQFAKDLVTPGGQEKLLADPETAGMAGAITSPFEVATGQGETPMAATARENIERTGNAGVGNENTALMEGLTGGAGRIMATGGFAPLVEMGVKAAQINQNEPNRPLNSLGSLGRIAAAGAATYLPAKAGAAIEPLVARLGLGRLGGFMANAGADALVGASAGTAQKAAEMAGTGVPVDSPEFRQGLMPTVADAAMIVPSAIAAGMGGAHEAYMRTNPEMLARVAEANGWEHGVPMTEADHARVEQEVSDSFRPITDEINAEPEQVQQAQAEQAARDAYREALDLKRQENAGMDEQTIPAAPFPRKAIPLEPEQRPMNQAQRRAPLEASNMGMTEAEYLAAHGAADPAMDTLAQKLAANGVVSVNQAKKLLPNVSNDTIRSALQRASELPTPKLGKGIADRVGSTNPYIDEATPGLAQVNPDAQAHAYAQAEYDRVLHEEMQKRGLISPGQKQTLLLPKAEGTYTAGNETGVHLGSRDGIPDDSQSLPPLQFNDEEVIPSNGSRERETQGQAPGGISQMAGAAKAAPASASFGLSPLGMGRVTPRGNGPSEPIEPAKAFNPGLELLQSIQAAGANERDPLTGELPTRVNGLNINRFAGNDPNAQNASAGLASTNETGLNEQRGQMDNLQGRAAKHEKYGNADYVARLKTNNILSDEEATALDNFTKGAIENFRSNPNEETMKRAQVYLKASVGVGSAQGRALGARAINRTAWESALAPMDRALVNAQKMFTSANKDMPPSVMSRFADVKDKNDPREITNALLDIKKQHAGVLGQVSAYRFINMLSSPATHIMNAVSNLYTFGNEIGGRPAAILFDKVAPGSPAYVKNQTAVSIHGAYAGLGEAWDSFKSVLKNGFGIQDMKDLDPAHLHVELYGGSKNPLNYVTRLLTAADEFSKSIGDSFYRSGASYKKAYEEAVSKDLSGESMAKYIQDNAPLYALNDQKIDEDAKAFAEYIVHQEPSYLEKLKAGPGATPGAKVVINQAIDHIIPFVNIMQNVIKKGAIASGGGFLSPLAKSLSREQKLRNVAMATMGVGPALALLPHAMSGNITAAVPSDPHQRELFYEQGKQPYSINFFGHWFDYRKLGAYAYPIMLTAEYAEARADKKGGNTMLKMASNLAKAIVELPTLSAIGGLVDTLNDPDRYGPSFGANLISQYIPLSSAQRFINRNGLAGESGVPDAKTLGDRITAGTLASRMLPRKVNSFGKQIERGSEGDPVYNELARLGLNPPAAPTSRRLGLKSIPMSQDQKRAVLTTKLPGGQTQYSQTLEFINGQKYRNLPDTAKKAALDSFLKTTTKKYHALGLSRLPAPAGNK